MFCSFVSDVPASEILKTDILLLQDETLFEDCKQPEDHKGQGDGLPSIESTSN